jgi:hypothetical protein
VGACSRGGGATGRQARPASCPPIHQKMARAASPSRRRGAHRLYPANPHVNCLAALICTSMASVWKTSPPSSPARHRRDRTGTGRASPNRSGSPRTPKPRGWATGRRGLPGPPRSRGTSSRESARPPPRGTTGTPHLLHPGLVPRLAPGRPAA